MSSTPTKQAWTHPDQVMCTHSGGSMMGCWQCADDLLRHNAAMAEVLIEVLRESSVGGKFIVGQPSVLSQADIDRLIALIVNIERVLSEAGAL